MSPTQDAPAAQPESTQAPADAGSNEPGADGQASAAAATEQSVAPDEQVKKLGDRLAEQGRKNAELTRLTLQQTQELGALKSQMAAITPYLSQLQQSQERARLASMEPEQQIAYLNDKIARIQTSPPPQYQQPAVDPNRAEIDALLGSINGEFGSDVTAEDVGWHPSKEAWENAARLMARARANEKGPEVAAKKTENTAAPSAADIQKMIDQAVARATGAGAPNSANPAGGRVTAPQIADLNKIAGDSSLSPKQRVEKMRALQIPG